MRLKPICEQEKPGPLKAEQSASYRPSVLGTAPAYHSQPAHISLDDMLTPEQAATWLQMTKADVLRKCQGRHSVIPKCSLGHKTIRINPRLTIAKFADDTGVRPEIIAAALNLKVKV